jgi:hypothetical protein
MAINLRSPYYIGISNGSLSYAILELKIWNAETVIPATPQYNLRKSIIVGSTSVYFEVSELIRDFLEIHFNGVYISYCLVVESSIKAYNSANTLLTTVTDTNFAFDSYSYFEEPTFNLDNISTLITNRTIYNLADNVVRIPVHTVNNPFIYFYKNGVLLKSEQYLTDPDDSEFQIAYVTQNGRLSDDNYKERVLEDNGDFEDSKCLRDFLNEFELYGVDKIVITDDLGNRDTINIVILDECKYEPKKFTFINKFGALQDIYFFKKQVNKMDVSKESYNANTLFDNYTYDRSTHTKRDFNVKGKESFTFSSGYLSEEYNEVFKQMMLSEKVWITNITDTEEQVLPINVKTSNITYKTSLNDRLVEYTIEFENSYNVLNDIR